MSRNPTGSGCQGRAAAAPGRRAVMALAGAAIGVAALPAGRARAAAPDVVRLQLDWTPWGEQAAFHLARAKGWYASAGLDVHVQDGNGSTSTVQIVANDSDIDVGAAALSSMMIGRDKGEDLRAVATYARNSDIGLMVPNDSPIRKVSDLRGKRLGYTASSLEGPFLSAFLATGGLTRSDCHLFNLDGGAKLGAYLAGRLDGAFSSIPFFLPVVATKRASRAILFADVGLRFPSYGLFATDRRIAQRKEVLTRFVSVSDGAWAYIADGHAEEGVRAILHERPQAKIPAAVMHDQVKTYLTFFPTPATRGKPVGWQAAADWDAAVRTMAQAKLIKPGDPAASFYTNALLDPALYRRVAGV